MKLPPGLDRKNAEIELVAAKPKDMHYDKLGQPWLEGNTLYATDSYSVVRLPVERDKNDVDGFVPIDALKAARKSRHFPHVLLENDSAVALPPGGRVEVNRGEWTGDGPKVDQLFTEREDGCFTVALNAEILYRTAKALGTDSVRLTFAPAEEKPELKPILVRPLTGGYQDGRDALVMPVRLAK